MPLPVQEKIQAFANLGEWIGSMTPAAHRRLAERASGQNPWFTESNVRLSLEGVARFLDLAKLEEWAGRYTPATEPRRVGVAMAGNIPLVGFHDALCVLISGHYLKAKLSSQDRVLLPYLLAELVRIEPRFTKQFSFEERLTGTDAAIATGSDNTARYFEYYFRHIPHIIRKNRSSCGIIMGEEPPDQLTRLGRDVFSHFGLGCRNVAKLFVPEGYDFTRLLEAWTSFRDVINFHKYAHNYDYQKAILLVNKVPFYDHGAVLLVRSEPLVSPIAVVHYEPYRSQEELALKIASHREKLQCMVSAGGWYPGSVPFGEAQFPDLDDYADHVDTMKFLTAL